MAKEFPNKVGYYAKDGINYETIIAKQDDPEIDLAGMGLDSNIDIRDYFRKTTNGFVQGNFSEHLLTLPHEEFLPKLDIFINQMSDLAPEDRAGWVCGLGHGVLKQRLRKTSKNLYKESGHPFKEWILKKKNP